MSTRTKNGAGSVGWDEENCRWKAAISLGKDAQGKPIRKHLAVKARSRKSEDKQVAKRRLLEKVSTLQDQYEKGVQPDAEVFTVKQWLRHYLDNIAKDNLRTGTWVRYDSLVRTHLIPHLGHIHLAALEPESIEACYRKMRETVSGSSTLQAHRVLSKALKVAEQRRRIARNPCALVNAPSNSDKRRAVPFTREQAQQLIAVATWGRNKPRWVLALSLGMRQGEVLGLTWEHVDLDQGVIRVRQSLMRIPGHGLALGPLKSRASRRDLALEGPLLELMKLHKKEQDVEREMMGEDWKGASGLVFTQPNGRPVDPSRDWGEFQGLQDICGIPRRGTHSSRHTAASLLAKSGVSLPEARDILGHSQVSLTADVYTHVDAEQSRAALGKVASLLFAEKEN